MSIWDEITNSFKSGMMEPSPSVMDEGTRVVGGTSIRPPEDPMTPLMPTAVPVEAPPYQQPPMETILPDGLLPPPQAPRLDPSWTDLAQPPSQDGAIAREQEALMNPPVPPVPPEEAERVPGAIEGIIGDPSLLVKDLVTPGFVPHESIKDGAGVPPSERPPERDMDDATEDFNKRKETDPAFNDPSDDDPEVDPALVETVKQDMQDAPPTPGAATPDAAAAAIDKDPKGFAKAMGWFSDTFGINGQDLAQFGLFYAGSRIAGYNHGGSMTFAFNEGMKSSRARTLMAQQLSDAGKFTQKSIAAFKRKGDHSLLKKEKVPSKRTTDYTKTYRNKKGQAFWETKLDNGDKAFIDKNGNISTEEMVDPKDEKTIQGIVDDNISHLTKIGNDQIEYWKKGQTGEDGFGEVKGYNIGATEGASTAIRIIQQELGNSGMNLTTPVYTKMYKQAVDDAVRFAKATGKQVNDIGPFILDQIHYASNNDPWALALMKDGEQLDTREFGDIKSKIRYGMKDTPEWKAAEANGHKPGALAGHVLKELYDQYRVGVKDGHEPSENNGFYNFVMRKVSGSK